MMNHQLQGKDKAPVDSDLSHNNFLYNTFSSHQRLAHQVGLQQRDPLLMMHDQRRNDNFLAVAVQQQLVASLASAPIQLYPSLGGQSHTMNAADLPGNLLSIAQQNQHNAAALMQRLSGHTNTPNNYFAFGMSPKLVDSLVREATSTTKQPTTTVTQQIPCLARGMATDHNSMVSGSFQCLSIHLYQLSLTTVILSHTWLERLPILKFPVMFRTASTSTALILSAARRVSNSATVFNARNLLRNRTSVLGTSMLSLARESPLCAKPQRARRDPTRTLNLTRQKRKTKKTKRVGAREVRNPF